MGIKSNREEIEIPAMPLEEKEMSLLSFSKKSRVGWEGDYIPHRPLALTHYAVK
jgi:hypothetical protein